MLTIYSQTWSTFSLFIDDHAPYSQQCWTATYMNKQMIEILLIKYKTISCERKLCIQFNNWSKRRDEEDIFALSNSKLILLVNRQSSNRKTSVFFIIDIAVVDSDRYIRCDIFKNMVFYSLMYFLHKTNTHCYRST